MITLHPVNKENFFDVIRLSVTSEQEQYVSDNKLSLAQAWLYPDITRPFAIYNDNQIVGFLMCDWDKNKRSCGLWRFMIDQHHQNKGYGKSALQALIQLVTDSHEIDFMNLSYVPKNPTVKLYRDLGFIETGEIEDDEIIMIRKINTSTQSS